MNTPSTTARRNEPKLSGKHDEAAHAKRGADAGNTAFSLVFRMSLSAAALPLFITLFVMATAIVRLRAEGLRAAEIEATALATRFADLIAMSGKLEIPESVAQIETETGALVALFQKEGTPIAGGGLDNVERADVSRAISGETVETTYGGQRLAVAACPVESGGDSAWVVAAARRPSIGKAALTNLALLAGAGMLLALFAAAAGRAFGKRVVRRFVRIEARLSGMIDGGEPPRTRTSRQPDSRFADRLDRAVAHIDEKYRGEFAMYRDALEEVRILDDKRTDFLEALSKELYAPLGRIMNETDSLMSGARGELSDTQADDVRIVHQACRRLLKIVNEVQDLSSLISRGIEYDDEPVDIAAVAKEVIETTRGELGKKELKLVLRTDDSPPPLVRGSRQGLWQIMTNLVSNAIKFTNEGEVAMRIGRTDDGKALIEVADTGVGIPSASLNDVFDPFKQPGDKSKRLKGYGLGLAICKRLVDLHEGEISLSSVEGKGSRFTVTLWSRK